jgi:hypothetical protein
MRRQRSSDIAVYLERFWAKVSPANGNGCRLWTACTMRSARGLRYGHFRGMGGRMIAAHRFIYGVVIGPIPDGLVVRHKCDVSLCVNPDHLEVGTPKDNAQDCITRGRRVLARGESHGRSVNTAARVLEIRSLIAQGMGRAAVARELGIPVNLVKTAQKYWRHLDTPETGVMP